MKKEDGPWETLFRAGVAGDEASYARFLHEVAPVIRGLVRAKGRTLGEAACEDVLQEVLLAVHVKRHTWRRDSPVRPWLYAIARYKVADAFRARGAQVLLPIEDFAETLPAPEAADPMLARDAHNMINRLDPRSADIVRAIGLEGEEPAATGRRLSMTEGAVRVALHRALKRLAALRERFVE